ncbi:hypothetical protein ABZ541_01650 [Micromonospora sediminicola]|uniref:hypothetical protein n=1 Tax=Micromonospora sediminicola TaxID=946078 RepID=UPI0033DA6189
MSRWNACRSAALILAVAVLAGCARSAPESPVPAPATPAGTADTVVTVTVSVGGADGRIAVTVTNGSQVSVYADDLRTDCSPVLLERRAGDTWTAYDNCGVERAGSVVTWAPGERREFRLDPAGGDGVVPPAPAGVYRVTLGFRRSPAPEGTVAERVHSAPFRIG